jgi:hypothetical protein
MGDAKNATALTVRELIDLLNRCPQDSPVEVEGCDCTGDATGVEIGWDLDVTVLVRRYTPLGEFLDNRKAQTK